MNQDIALAISPALLIVVQLIKQAVPETSKVRGFIPHISVLLGTIAYVFAVPMEEGQQMIFQILHGIVVGASAVGLHQLAAKTQTAVKNVPMWVITGFLAGSLFVLSACSTTGPDGERIPPTPETVEKASASIGLTSQIGAYVLVRENPETAIYFMEITTILERALEDGKLTPEDILPLVNDYILDNNPDPDVALAIQGALSLYRIWFADNIQGLNLDHYAVQYLEALIRGLQMGASLVPPDDDANLDQKNFLLEVSLLNDPFLGVKTVGSLG